MAYTIKKLDLVRETVRSMRTRTGMRTGMRPVTQVPDGPIDDSAGASSSSGSSGSSSVASSGSSRTGNNASTMTSAMDVSLTSTHISH